MFIVPLADNDTLTMNWNVHVLNDKTKQWTITYHGNDTYWFLGGDTNKYT